MVIPPRNMNSLESYPHNRSQSRLFAGSINGELIARKVRTEAAGYIMFIAGFDLLLGIAITIFSVISRSTDSAQSVTILIVNSILYTVLGTVLFKSSRRIVVSFVAAAILLDLIYTLFDQNISISDLIVPGILFWVTARATYATFLLHKKWPSFDKISPTIPKKYYIVYVPLLLQILLVFIAVIFSKI